MYVFQLPSVLEANIAMVFNIEKILTIQSFNRLNILRLKSMVVQVWRLSEMIAVDINLSDVKANGFWGHCKIINKDSHCVALSISLEKTNGVSTTNVLFCTDHQTWTTVDEELENHRRLDV